MIKREANFGSLFRHWLMANTYARPSAAYELKQTRTDRIRWDAVKEHQIDALFAAKSPSVDDKGLLYKAPDDSRGMKPFDFFYLHGVEAYVVIRFPEFFCLIDVETWVYAAGISNESSCTGEEARRMATTIVELKKTKSHARNSVPNVAH